MELLKQFNKEQLNISVLLLMQIKCITTCTCQRYAFVCIHNNKQFGKIINFNNRKLKYIHLLIEKIVQVTDKNVSTEISRGVLEWFETIRWKNGCDNSWFIKFSDHEGFGLNSCNVIHVDEID